MPKFLNTEELYRILQRESPEDVYPDGAPEAFYSTAENHSVADAVSGVYKAMEQVYNNFFPQTANEQITEWEIKVFGKTLPAALTLQERRDRIIGQLRSQLSISMWDILTFVNSYVPVGVYTQVLEYSSAKDEGWILDESLLDFSTVLNYGNVALFFGDSACEVSQEAYLNPATKQQVLDARIAAYFYEIRIYDYTIPAEDLADMIANVYQLHPVRSDFAVFQNMNLVTEGYIVPVNNVDRIDNINCIARDSTSTTGYVGRKKG